MRLKVPARNELQLPSHTSTCPCRSPYCMLYTAELNPDTGSMLHHKYGMCRSYFHFQTPTQSSCLGSPHSVRVQGIFCTPWHKERTHHFQWHSLLNKQHTESCLMLDIKCNADLLTGTSRTDEPSGCRPVDNPGRRPLSCMLDRAGIHCPPLHTLIDI